MVTFTADLKYRSVQIQRQALEMVDGMDVFWSREAKHLVEWPSVCR